MDSYLLIKIFNKNNNKNKFRKTAYKMNQIIITNNKLI